MVATPPISAIAFRDPRDGLLAAGATVALTADGGRTWRVVLRARRLVRDVGFAGRLDWAELANRETLGSRDGDRTWHRVHPPLHLASSPCRPPLPGGAVPPARAGRWTWAVCTGGAGAGSMAKAVYRSGDGGLSWRLLAAANFARTRPASRGGIGLFGYPVGIAMARDGFGLIWESRGTLYLTRDGGSRWKGLPLVARPEIDFGQAGAALPGGVGFVVLSLGGNRGERLIETRDYGRTWRVVHRWD